MYIYLSILIGNTFALKTPDYELYGNQWLAFKSNKRLLNFEVRACSNARLRLSQLPFTSPQYEVVFGTDSNRKTQLMRYNGGVASLVAEEETLGIVDCFESKRFDVSWYENKIRVSRGSGSGQVVLDWQESQRSVRVFAASLSTGPQSNGDWKVLNTEGKYIPSVGIL